MRVESLKARRACDSAFRKNFHAMATDHSTLLFYDPLSHMTVSDIQISGDVSAMDFKFECITIATAIVGSGAQILEIPKRH
jgi:hypothetical protein